MNQIDIIIATRNRLEKLKGTIDSIPQSELDVPIHINLACDGDIDTYNEFRHDKRVSEIFFTGPHKGAVYCRNELSKECKDAVLYATDDIVFKPGAIEKAIKAARTYFKDDDFVIGFAQEGNRKFCKSGVGMIGKEFMKRFPEGKIFYPGYFHFAAQEILALAEKHRKFYFCEGAIVTHLNPFINNQYMDNTHKDARLHKEKDMRMSEDRRNAGIIWGDDA